MALPTYSLQCPSARGVTLRYSQVGAGKALSFSSKFGGRSLELLAWRRRCHWGPQRTGLVKVMGMGRKKEVGNGGENDRPELKLEAADLMELEFGRLLGEPRQATLAKVIGRKVNPEVSYIEIEKKPIKKFQSSSSSSHSETEFTGLLNREGRPNLRPAMGVNPTSESNEDLPGLVKPPMRPGKPPPQVSRRAPSVSSAKTSSTAQGKLQKAEGALDDAFLRRPTTGDRSVAAKSPGALFSDLGSRVSEGSKVPLLTGKPSEAKLNKKLSASPGPAQDSLPSDISEERFTELLDLSAPTKEDQVSRRMPSANPAKTSPAAQGKKAVPLVTFGPGGFAAKTKKPPAEEEDYMGLVQKPAIPSPDSYKPSWPKNDVVPPMLIGKPKKVEEDDYMGLVQKPTVPSPDSFKPSWPKNDSVPPMLISKSNNAEELLDEALMRRPTPGDRNVRAESPGALVSDLGSRVSEDPKVPSLTGNPLQAKLKKKLSASPGPVQDSPPSDISDERFAELLDLAAPTKEDNQDVSSESSTTSTAASMDNSSTRQKASWLGPKPVLAAKPPLQVVESKEVAREDLSMSTSSNDVPKASLASSPADLETARLAENAEPSPSHSDDESGVDMRGPDEKLTDIAKPESIQSDPEQSILRLVKKASRIVPVGPPKRLAQAILDPVKAKFADAVSSADDRLAGWSDEVKAAVKRSEAALPTIGRQASSETEFDLLLQRREAELRKRPVRPSTPEIPPDPAEVSMQQRFSTRPVVPSPKPPQTYGAASQDAPANLSLQSGASLSDKRIPTKEDEDKDWARAEALRESRTVEEVVFSRASANGLLVNFGSLEGFLAAYELSSRRRPASFTTWARDNGLIINKKLKSLVASENDDPGNGSEDSKRPGRTADDDEEYKRLLQLYGEARANILAALVGETAKVVIVAVERERKQLRFSEKDAEGEGQEIAKKKEQLMASLKVGDVVKCSVKKVTNFGAFVELQGVPALIHISELSWNRVTDPSTILNAGQEVEVKVCRLDRNRINLSLKQMQPDPLRETLESLVSNDLREAATSVGAPYDNETTGMPELIGVTKRLEAYKGIDSVQIGRRIQGTALAPTFQVYLSGQLDDGFKLLARSGNQVQEVLVQTALDRESMKDAIRQCTFSDD